MGELILDTHVLEYEKVLDIKRYIPAEASLMKQVLCDYHADVPVFIALGQEIATSLE